MNLFLKTMARARSSACMAQHWRAAQTPCSGNRFSSRSLFPCLRTSVVKLTVSVSVLVVAFFSGIVCAETGAEAWLRYAPLAEADRARYANLPASIAVFPAGDSQLLHSAQQELIRGSKGMLGRTLRGAGGEVKEPSFVLGTIVSLGAAEPEFKPPSELHADSFWLKTGKIRGFDCIVIAGATDRGVLYGVFALLSRVARGESISALDEVQQPYAPIRWVDQWDNLDGRIERGYAGRSIFFDGGRVRDDLSRARDYARLLASVGINGCAINNVNADPRVL